MRFLTSLTMLVVARTLTAATMGFRNDGSGHAGRSPDPRLSRTGALPFAGDRLSLRAWRHLYGFKR